MIPEDLERRTRQELIDIILILVKILKEEDAVIEQNDIFFSSGRVERLKKKIKDM